MNTIIAILMVSLVVFAFAAWISSRPRGKQLRAFANVAEGRQPRAQTLLADGVLAVRNLVMKRGSDARHVAACGVGDIPLGVANDTVEAAEEGVTVRKFGLNDEGELGVASGAIAQDDFLVPGAAGTVRTLPAAAGTYYIIGRATKAAADTDPVEYTPCFPIQRVVE